MRRPYAVFGAAFAVYMAVGLVLSLRFGYLLGDALSRTSAAQAVLFSRDPHVSAIGFVFTPLTSLVQLPVVYFAQWWPDITRWNFSGILMSSVFMAGAVVAVRGICVDRDLGWGQTLAVTVLFAVNPMILFYGANGMSESLFLFFVIVAVRRLIRWTRSDDVHDIGAAGIVLGFAYLTRYDAVSAIAAAAVTVFAVTLFRQGLRQWRSRIRDAVLDAVIVTLPGFGAFCVWAATSWLITGEAFAQFSSTYGNSAILEQSGTNGAEPLQNAAFSITEMLILGPVLPILVPVAVVLAYRRRDVEFWPAPMILGAVLAFQAVSYIGGSTFPLLRFYVCAIPLMIVLLIQLCPPAATVPARRPGPQQRIRAAPVRSTVVATASVLTLAATLPLTGAGMLSPDLSSQQFALRSLVSGELPGQDQLDARRIVASFRTERTIADYLDTLGLPRGSVLLDTVYGFAVVVASDRPDMFVVPSDEDFTTILNDPAKFGIQYVLAVPNEGRGISDAVNRRYPTLYDNGAGVATLALEIPNDGADQPDWRLYRV